MAKRVHAPEIELKYTDLPGEASCTGHAANEYIPAVVDDGLFTNPIPIILWRLPATVTK